MAEKLKIIALGGLNEIGKNLTVYEYGNDIVVVDCGMGFPDDDMYGIDVVIPDISYLIKNAHKIRGIFLTHGHGDHAGGAYALATACGAKVYAMQPAADFVANGDTDALSLTPAIEAGVYEEGYTFKACPVEPIADGDVLKVGKYTMTVVVSEGHSAGHCCYVLEADGQKALFVGDAIQCGGKIALQAIWDCDLQKYVDTIHRLNAIKPDLLLPGHGCVALNRGYLHIEKAEKILETLALPKNCIGE